MGTPGGGPEDKEQPEVIGTVPALGSTQVGPREKIEIYFSELVDPATLEASIFVAPTPSERPKVKVHGHKAVITLPDSIPANGALTVTVGAGVKDLHGNTLKSSFTLAVTAGNRIPTGSIVGRVYADGVLQGVIVGAWPQTGEAAVRPDTLLAPLLTQCDVDGYFKLDYLPAGSYRVCAWGDRDGNRKYAPGTDYLALSSNDLSVMEDSVVTLNLWAAKRDTAEVRPAYASPIDHKHISVRLTRAPGSALQKFLGGAVASDSTGNPLAILTSWADPLDSAKLVFQTALQDSNASYTMYFMGDTSGLPFKGSPNPDTTRLKLAAFSPKSNSRDALLQPSGQLLFDDALIEVPANEAVKLMIADSIQIAVELHWDAPNRVNWKALEEVEAGSKCKLNVDLVKFKDRSGNSGADSVFTILFETTDPAALGSIAGTVTGGDGAAVWVAAKPIDGAKKTPKASPRGAEGDYQIEGLDPGRYVVWSWSDRQNDSKLSLGNLAPFEFAEPFVYLPDTITVRARWQNGNINLKLP